MRKICLFLAVVMIFPLVLAAKNVKNKNKILIIVAPHNFRDEEFQKPYNYFLSEGYSVTVVSTTTDSIRGMLGLKIRPDKLLSAVDPDSFNIVVMPGGTGAVIYFKNKIVREILNNFKNKNKIIAAICLSPVTLAKNGILKGKRATAWPSAFTEKELRQHGAIYVDSSVVIDGNIITANGPKSALPFAKAIDSVFTHKKEVKDVK